jgi:putative transposase
MPHHVTQRGNRRMDVFFTPEDRHLYLALLHKYRQRYGLDIYAYCLMTNHLHLVAVPSTPLALSHTLRDTHSAYAAHINRQQAASGHLWQGRFYSCVLDDAHLWAAVRYVERNPVRAGLVAQAVSYPWSSAPAHARGATPPLLSPAFPPPGLIRDWTAWLQEEETHVSDHLRQRTHVGRPCRDTSFIAALEGLLQRRLRPLTPGRKPKKRGDKGNE